MNRWNELDTETLKLMRAYFKSFEGNPVEEMWAQAFWRGADKELRRRGISGYALRPKKVLP